jgi:hypothetical protein
VLEFDREWFVALLALIDAGKELLTTDLCRQSPLAPLDVLVHLATLDAAILLSPPGTLGLIDREFVSALEA